MTPRAIGFRPDPELAAAIHEFKNAEHRSSLNNAVTILCRWGLEHWHQEQATRVQTAMNHPH